MTRLLASALILLTACGGGAAVGDAGRDSRVADAARDAMVQDADGAAPIPDAAISDARVPEQELVTVSHERELRGGWVATVSRIDWPSSDDPVAQRAELSHILDGAVAAGLNAVFLQVRPAADALYPSELEPWSVYLTGTQGEDPGYDPLQYAIEECQERGLELHAWLNPYRARASAGALAPNHVSNRMPEAVVSYGRFEWLDPGHPRALEHTLSVIRDLVARYDIDGVHFDDYFYPYPEAGLSFDDDATFAAHGGSMSRDDWRRDNVNGLVRRVGEVVAEERSDVRFGISPFGIYRPGMPEGVVGLDQYAALYADPPTWMRQGWLDYLAPQLYWPTTSTGQSYDRLLDFWAELASATDRTLLIGASAARRFGLDEYRAEIDAMRGARDRNALGTIFWSISPLVRNEDGIRDMLRGEYFGAPAATPALVDAEGPDPDAPSFSLDGGRVTMTSPPEALRFWAVYEERGSAFELHRLVPAGVAEFSLAAGRWAISAIDRSGLESLGAKLTSDGVGSEPVEPPAPTGAACTHSFGGRFVDGACSPSYQCCDGSWGERGGCGECVCEEATGEEGCGG